MTEEAKKYWCMAACTVDTNTKSVEVLKPTHAAVEDFESLWMTLGILHDLQVKEIMQRVSGESYGFFDTIKIQQLLEREDWWTLGYHMHVIARVRVFLSTCVRHQLGMTMMVKEEQKGTIA